MFIGFSQLTFSQTITSFSSTSPILCFGGSTNCLVTTSASSITSLNYYLEQDNGFTGYQAYPGFPQTSTNTLTINNLFTGSYRIIIQNTTNLVFLDTLEYFLNAPPDINIVNQSLQMVSCLNGNDGQISLMVMGGVGPYNYSWSNGQSTPNISNLTAGVYTCNITDINGCLYDGGTAATFNITQPSTSISVSSTSSTSVSCNGGNDGTVTVTPSGGTPPYSYLWSDGQTSQTATGLSTGTYTCFITDVNGCSQGATIFVSESSIINASISSSSVSCFGLSDGSASVSVNGGSSPYSYLWSTGQTISSIGGLSSGTYICTVTDNLGCSYNNPLITQITQPSSALLLINSSSTSVTCFGGNDGSAQANITGGTPPYSHSWSPSGGSNQVATSLSAGNYTSITTDVNGCVISSGTITVGQPSSPISVTSSNTMVPCNGGNNGTATVTPTGGTSPYSFLWSNGATSQTISAGAGTYSCDIFDANGCPYQSNPVLVTISEPLSPLMETTNQTNVSCNGGNDGSATVTPTGGTPPYSFLWSNGATTASVSGLSAGNYTCLVIDFNGCSHVGPNISLTITEPSNGLSFSTDSTGISCNGGNNGTATVMSNGGTPPYSYLWSDGQTTLTATGLSSGIYTFIITDANSCVIDDPNTQYVIVTEPSTSIILNTNTITVSCNGGTNGMASVVVNGGLSPYTYLWSNGQTSSTITGLNASTLSISVTDNNSCTVSESVSVSQPFPLTIPIISTDVSCNGGGNAIATANPSGGTSPYTYIWSNNDSTQTATNLSAGIYTVTVTDSFGCAPTTSSILIIEPSPIISSSLITHLSCTNGNDGSIVLSVTGGNGPYTYLWSDGQTTSTASNLSAGQYSVVIIDSTLCSVIFSYNITEPSTELSGSLNIVDVSCNGGNDGMATVIVVGGTSPYIYVWPNGQNSSSLTNLSAGSYNCTIVDNNGCLAYASGTVDEPSLFTLTTSTNSASCNGFSDGAATVIPQGGTSPYTYNWSNGLTTQTAINLSAGQYSVIVLDSQGCSASALLTVSEPSAIVVNLNTVDVSCYGDSTGVASITASGTAPPFSYYWSNGITSQINSNLPSGSYSVAVTDGMGCSETSYFNITEPSQINVTFLYSNVSVNGANDGSISSNVTGGIPLYSYLWTSTTNINYSASGSSINNLAPGVYQVVVSDANNCSQTFSQVINQPNCAVIIDSSYTSPLCWNEMGSLSWINSGGVAPYSNTLINSNGNIIVNGQLYSSPNIPLQLPSGVYNLVVIDASGCSSILNIPIINPDQIQVNLSLSDASCFGYSNGTASVVITGGVAPYITDWGLVNPNALDAGNYNVMITDNNNCDTIINYTINEPTQIQIDSVPTTLVSCTPGIDGSATIYGSGGTLPYTYYWSNGQTTQTAVSLTSGTYISTIFDANSCNVSTSLPIVISNAPQLNVNIQTTPISCTGFSDGSITSNLIIGSSPITYSWFDLSNPNVVISSDSFVNNLSYGAYSLLATDINGCIDQNNITLFNPTPITFTLQSNNITFNGANNGSINTVAPNGGTFPYSYFWAGPNGFTSSTQNLTGLQSGQYTLTITDDNGCTSVMSAVINEPSCNVQITTTIVQPICYGLNGTLSWINSGGMPSYNNTLLDLNTNSIFYNNSNIASLSLTEGNYALIVEDLFGCQDIENITILGPPPITSNITITDASCNGGNDGSVIVIPSGGTTPYSYNWGGVNTNALSAGIYAVTVTDFNGCQSLPSPITYQISEPSVITPTVSSTPVSCTGGGDGSAVVSVSGGTYPYTYLWSTSGSSSPSINNLTAGTYYISVTDDNGCPSTGSVVITEPNNSVGISITPTHVGCNGDSDGEAIAYGIGGTPPYSYLWSNGQTTQTSIGLSAGTYNCVVIDANNCVNTTSTTINEPSPIVANESPIDVSCFGLSDGSVTVNPSGGSGVYNVIWMNGMTSMGISGLSAGTAFVTITDNTGCTTESAPTSFVIYQPNPLVLTTSVVSQPSCNIATDGEVTVNVIGGTTPYSYDWENISGVSVSTNVNADNVGQGYYLVTVTDINSCSDTAGIQLGAPTSISVNLTVDSVSCFGGSDGSAQVNPTGGTSPYSYSWTGPGSLTNSVNGLNASTTYYVSITDANNCSLLPISVNVPEPDPLVLTSSIIPTSCNGGADGEIMITNYSGGTPPLTYLWSDGQTGSIASNLSAGNYTVISTDANGCIDNNSFTVTQPSQLSVLTLPSSIVSCNGGSNGSVYANATGGTIPYSYLWSSTNIISTSPNLPQINYLLSGNYLVTVSDGNGCIATSSITLQNQSSIVIYFDTSNYIGYNISCYDGNDGEIIASASGGLGSDYGYSWDFGSTNDTVSSLSSGTYILTVTDSVGCIQTDTISLSDPDSIILSSTSTSISCYDATDGTLSVSVVSGGVSPYTYLWSDGQITQTSIGLSDATYNCVVTDANNCATTTSLTITEPSFISSLLTITSSSYNGFDVQCYDSANAEISAVTTGGLGNQYIYSTDPSFTNSTPTSVFPNVSTGTFYVYTQDINGCLGFDSIYVNGPNQIIPNINITSGVTCSGGTDGELYSNTSGGISPYSYTWSNGSVSGNVINSLSEGTYSVTITDSNGCVVISNDTMLSAQYQLISNITTNLVTCTGGSDGSAIIDTVIGGTSPYTYLWSNTNTTAGIAGLSAGIFTVEITDSNSCTITDTLVISEADSILIIDSVSISNLLCYNDSSGSFEIFAGGGQAPYTYLISDLNNNTIGTSSTIYMLDSDTFLVYVTDITGCTYVDSVYISQPNPLNPNLLVTDISCFGYSDGVISSNTSGGTSPYIFNWSGPNSLSSSSDSIINLNFGEYVLFLTDFNECEYTDTVTITEPLPIAFGVSYINPTCNNYTNGTISLDVSGGIPPYTSTFGSSLPYLITNDSIFFDSLTSGTNALIVTDLNGCISQNNVNLTNPLLIEEKSHSETSPTCFGYNNGSATIEAMGGTPPYSYFVYNNDNIEVGNSSTTNGLIDGLYYYYFMDNNGCSDTLSFTISEPLEISIIENSSTNVECYNTSTGTLFVDVENAIGNYQIFWTEVIEDSVFIDNLSAGIYRATVIDENTCVKVDSFYITQNDEIITDITTQNASCAMIADGIIFVNSIVGGVPPYNVYNNSENIIENEYISANITSLLATKNDDPYRVTITDESNCEVEAWVLIDFDGGYNCINESIIISPNVDGINDSWEPILDIDTDIEVSILNRWGELEFYYSGNSISFSWNGLSSGGYKLPTTDYYYIIKFNNDNYPDITGAITLIR